ncbi:type II toxin-antitoxin system VapC family toxin [Fibrella aestuarina]|uniref:type II toxin-antitoxin system VapC family toxin n=1 Tax=Fibrella aestuarina TaxID=651143 RepID=UPI00059C9208|nr:type II toxin-antitoxin system VapC family toxin [Fibrella aestuarina]
MPFSALPIKNHNPFPGRKYLFDANAWIFVLEADLELKQSTTSKADLYIDLLGKINQAGSPKPKVVLPAIVLSEVVNRLLRSYYFPLFVEQHKTLITSGSDSQNYKQVYRPHHQFRIDYEVILYNIKAYHNILELVSDGFGEMSVRNVFTKPDNTLDFNDYLLVDIAKRNNFIVVSDDGDLAGRDITVVTGNQAMLRWQAT